MDSRGAGKTISRILVIDDDPDIAHLLVTILESQGSVVYHACDGREGLKKTYELHPDLIIGDTDALDRLLHYLFMDMGGRTCKTKVH